MVRVFLKGGVWKNSEDEVLKAAVQKYGKQQWARVASLLNRKTAKQAKARWYEWLDPGIKKTEWSRAEEEKLLHLAKLLPSQWRTIAPMVGRTAAQCQEHYERLLDQAAGPSSSSAEGGAAGAADQLLLRAGQIDSHPETKPAKPDPVDMDEDELEMLQEARARLANTLGKKAKRKQREKMLAQAKRLADLQKRRELKAAGLLASRAKKKASTRRNEIDLGVEIPFYKPAPAGFHDTSGERLQSLQIQQRRSGEVDLHQVNESRYRTRDYEEAAARRREERRLQLLEKMNATYEKEKREQDEAAAMAGAAMRAQRGPLLLPEPTVTDEEMAGLAKALGKEREARRQGLGARSGPTAALLGGDDDQSLRTVPAFPNAMAGSVAAGSVAGGAAAKSLAGRSLAAASASSTVRQRRDLVEEARQLRLLERGPAPLLLAASATAGEAEEEDEEAEEETEGRGRDEGTAFEDDRKMPARSVAGESRHAGRRGGAGDAPSVGASTWATGADALRELARQERRAAKLARRRLEQALAGLPEPQYEYELAAPPPAGPSAGAEEEEGERLGAASTVTEEQDQADVEAEERERQRLRAEERYRERSSVLQRPELPRPRAAGSEPPSASSSPASASDAALGMIQREMLALIRHDNHKYPVVPPESVGGGGSKKKRKRKDGGAPVAVVLEEVDDSPPPPPLPAIAGSQLEAARALIDAELEDLVSGQVADLLSRDAGGALSSPEDAIAVLSERALEASRAGAERMVRTEEGWVESPTDGQVAASLRLEFEQLRQATESLRKRNDKAEAKLKVVNGGYARVADKCERDAREALDAVRSARIERAVYASLQSQEARGGSLRVERLEDDVRRLQSLEAELQRRYGDLVVERRRRAAVQARGASGSPRQG